MDSGTLQAVVRADGQVEILDLLVQLGVGLLALRREDGRDFALLLVDNVGQAQKRAHVLVDDVGRAAHGLGGRDAAVSLNFQHELVADPRGCR